MTTRRTFLRTLGVSALVPEALIGQESKLKRSRWDLLFGGDRTVKAPLKPDPRSFDPETITAAWIGHSTILINFFGTTILTDPVFSNRIGLNLLGLTTLGPRRLVEPALSIQELPSIDLILLSHAHMDHLDVASLAKFSDRIPIIMAKNTSDVIDELGRRDVHELDWGERRKVGDIEVEALQVKHFGWRYPWEQDRSKGNWEGRSYNAYLISKNGKNVVFGGDTAYQQYFRSLKERNVRVELAMMPIGAYDPWIYNHANPEQSLEMAQQMGAKNILPMHWGTFIQSDEPTQEPIERMKKAVSGSGVKLALERHGETWVMPKDEA